MDGMHDTPLNQNRYQDMDAQAPYAGQGVHTRAGVVPTGIKVDSKAVKKLVGEAILKVDGVLGVEGGFADMLKADDDVTRGLTVTMSDDGTKAQVGCKVITEYGRNIPDVVSMVQQRITETLRDMAGLTVSRVEVEVADIMTPEDYAEKYDKSYGDFGWS